MSTKRILSITIFGLLLIVAFIVTMLLVTSLRRESSAVMLPETPLVSERPSGTEHDALSRVEAGRETIQNIISTLERPEIYSRNIIIENFWEDGSARFYVEISVKNQVTSIHITPPFGPVRRTIVTDDAVYIWEDGDSTFFTGAPTAVGADQFPSDEWQMLLTFESIEGLGVNDIVDAGYVELDGELCFFVVYNSPLLGNLRTYYISLEFGLIVAVHEYDEHGILIYSMSSEEPVIGEAVSYLFILPDGTEVLG